MITCHKMSTKIVSGYQVFEVLRRILLMMEKYLFRNLINRKNILLKYEIVSFKKHWEKLDIWI